MLLLDVFVKCFVFVMVINLLLIIFGIVVFIMLSLCEYFDIDLLIVLVSMIYIGVLVNIVEIWIIQLLEDRILGIEGIKNVILIFCNGCLDIIIEFKFFCDIDVVVNDVCE